MIRGRMSGAGLRRVARATALLLCLAPLAGCGDGDGRSSKRAGAARSDGATLHSDGLAGIRERGELRILIVEREADSLPRAGSPLEIERDLATALASELGLEARFVPVEHFADLLPALEEGRGDLAAENITVAPERAERVTFSSPIDYVREQIVTRADDDALKSLDDLAGRALHVQPATVFAARARELQSELPELEIVEISDALTPAEIFDAVADGRFDSTLTDSNLLADALQWHDGIRAGPELPGHRIIAWAMRKDSPHLQRAVDRFLARTHRATGAAAPALADLEAIRERGVLRVLTRNSDTTYFIWRGKVMGFEYELARRFADSLHLRLEMVVPPSRDDLVPWLLAGRGDLIAAGLTSSDERARREGIAFSRRYQAAHETVATRADDTALEEVRQLEGRRIHVRPSSSYWNTLRGLQETGHSFELVAAPEELETEEILDRVATGEFDLTVADSPILEVALTWNDDLRAAFEIGDEVSYGWALRPDAPELLAAVDEFWKREYRGVFYNITRQKYFEDRRKVQKHVAARASRTGRISPWDELAQKYAETYGFDWRLIVAQMYQESRFDPKARSFAGAQGLLQVMPRTAREFGFTDLQDPAVGLEAGVRYLDWTRDRLDGSLPPDERTWFSLAAYNVGHGHVQDARRLARAEGLDPNRWFGHVEQAMLLKEKPEYHRKTRFGFARGREPVAYVASIRDLYAAYLEAADSIAAASENAGTLAPPAAPAP